MPIAANASVPVRRPVFVLGYEKVDITSDLTPFLIDVTYTDHAHGQADEVEVRLSDTDGRWRNGWYPAKGDRLDLAIGYDREPLLPAGEFRIDEITLSGDGRSGDTVTLKGLSASITKALRTARTVAYEETSLAGIAAGIAARHGLRVTGDIAAVPFRRVTQDGETDLGFLKRLAGDFGHVFSVRGEQLVFHRLAELEATAPMVTVHRTDVTRHRLSDKTRRVYKDALITYRDAATKNLIQATVRAEGIVTGDTLRITGRRVENAAQAEAIAKARLHASNVSRAEGSLTLPGDPRLVAGATVALDGWGALDGDYLVRTSRHRLARASGYTTELEIRHAL